MNATPNPFFEGRRLGLVCVLLFVGVACVFLPCLGHEFFFFDDPMMIINNAHIQDGLNLQTIQWAWGATSAGHWHPLTWMSHALDVQLYGLNPWGHHLTSVLLHAINAVLLFLVLRRLTGADWPSLFVAALFGAHPLRAESVAWVAERKDVLSGLFWMLAMWTYIRYVEETRKPSGMPRRFMALTLTLTALGLTAKSMLVTLPFVFLLLDAWPLGRLNWAASGRERLRQAARLTAEKLPFFALSAASSMLAFIAQKNSGAVMPMDALPLDARLTNVIVSYASYLAKLFWPSNLAIPYPLEANLSANQVITSALALALLTAGAVAVRRRAPAVLMGWLWFLGTMVPVIGLVQVGSQSMADRYTYIPGIGILIAVAWGVRSLVDGCPRGTWLAATAGVCATAASLVTTHRQVGYWQNTETLCLHSISVTRNNSSAMTILANYYIDRERWDDALESSRRAVEIAPWYGEALTSYGKCLAHADRIEEAISKFLEALRLDPKNTAAEDNLGVCMARRGRFEDAVVHFEKALRMDPSDASAHFNLARAREEQGRWEEATGHYREVLKLQPGNASVIARLAGALDAAGHGEEALAAWNQALRLSPKDADAACGLGKTLLKLRRNNEAAAAFQQALAIAPGHAEALRLLENLRANSP